MDVLDFSGLRPVLNNLDLRLIHGKAVRRDDVSEELDGVDAERLRKTSIVSVGQERRSSITHAILPTEERRGSQWSRRFSIGRANVEDRRASIYTVQDARRSDTSVASSSESGITIQNEERPPSPIQEMLDAQAPGTYILTVKGGEEQSHTKDEKTAVTVSISPLKYADKIARADFLDQYITQYPMPDIPKLTGVAEWRN